MSWFGSRQEKYIFKRVSWPGYEELEELPFVVGGSLELSSFSEMKVTGTLEVSDRDSFNDLIRVYYSFIDARGDSHTYALATVFPTASDTTMQIGNCSNVLDLVSPLTILAKKSYGRPYIIRAGVNPVERARDLCRDLGVKTNNPDSDYVLAEQHVFEPTASYLSIVNWCLDVAGYSSIFPDPMGVLQLVPYIEPQEREPVFTFTDGSKSIFFPEVVVSNNSNERYNACRLTYESDQKTYFAACINDDPTSETSTVNKGYEITLSEKVSEIEGNIESKLCRMAKKKLIDNSAGIEYATFKHPWVDIWPNDCVRLVYNSIGKEWSGGITNMSIDFTPGTVTTTKMRRLVRPTLDLTTESGWY